MSGAMPQLDPAARARALEQIGVARYRRRAAQPLPRLASVLQASQDPHAASLAGELVHTLALLGFTVSEQPSVAAPKRLTVSLGGALAGALNVLEPERLIGSPSAKRALWQALRERLRAYA